MMTKGMAWTPLLRTMLQCSRNGSCNIIHCLYCIPADILIYSSGVHGAGCRDGAGLRSNKRGLEALLLCMLCGRLAPLVTSARHSLCRPLTSICRCSPLRQLATHSPRLYQFAFTKHYTTMSSEQPPAQPLTEEEKKLAEEKKQKADEKKKAKEAEKAAKAEKLKQKNAKMVCSSQQ